MKGLVLKTKLIYLVTRLLTIVLAAGVLTYSWYFQGTETEDVLRLEASGAQIIIFEAGVSQAALTGSLYPARAKSQSYIDGSIPDKPIVIPVNGQIPDYIDVPAGIITFDTNLTYYAVGQSGKINLQVFSATTIKEQESPRNLQASNEIQVEYLFQIQDFNISIGEDATWHILNTSFPTQSTIYTREDKKYFDKSAMYTPLTGDKMVYNKYSDSNKYNIDSGNFITKENADVRIEDYQIAYIRNNKKYIQSYSTYVPSVADEVVFIKNIHSSLEDGVVEDVLLTSDLVFYRRDNKNYIEKTSVYNSGNGLTDSNSCQTGDTILFMQISNTTSPTKPIYLGNILSPSYVEYYISGSFSERYVVSKDYFDNNYGTNPSYIKVVHPGVGVITTTGDSNNGINFDESFIVFEREYSGTKYKCIDHVSSYTPKTGDTVLYSSYDNPSYVDTVNEIQYAKSVNIRATSDLEITDRDCIYIDDENRMRWALSSEVNFSELLSENLLYLKIVKIDANKVRSEQYIVEDGDQEITTEFCLVLNEVSFDPSYTLVEREFELKENDNPSSSLLLKKYLYYLDKSSAYQPKTNDLIYYCSFISEEILYNEIKDLYFVNNLDLQLDDVVYSRNETRHVLKLEDYESQEGDLVLFTNGRSVCRGMLKMDNEGFYVDRVGLYNDDTVYIRNGRIHALTSSYYTNPQPNDIVLYEDGVVTVLGANYIQNSPAGSMVNYYVDNVFLLPNDNVYCHDNKFRFIFKDGETYIPHEKDEMFYDSGFMVADAQTRFLVSATVYILTLDQETSRDLIGATLSIKLSMESPDIDIS